MSEALSIGRIPHQPPMHWIESAARSGDGKISCQARLPKGCCESARASILLGLEILAQAAGVMITGSMDPAETIESGRLLHVKSARWQQDSVALDSVLQADIEHMESSATGLHRVCGRLSDSAGKTLLEAEFNLLVKRSSQ